MTKLVIAVALAIAALSGYLWWASPVIPTATIVTLAAHHREDSVAAVVAGARADSALRVADSVRAKYRSLPPLKPLLAANAALQDSLAAERQRALQAANDSGVGVDSLEGEIRRLVAAGAHGDTVHWATVDALVERVGVLERVVTQDSVSLRAIVGSRDAERRRAVAAEHLAAGWQAEAARQGREIRLYRAAGVALVGVAGWVAIRR